MKTLTLSVVALSLLGTLTLGMAEDTASTSINVDAQISAIENAKTQEQRVALVNEFKTNISTLSKEDRTVAIEQLRSTMQANGERTQTHAQVRERTRVAQMEENENIQAQQQMNQHRAASQAMGQGMMSGSMSGGASAGMSHGAGSASAGMSHGAGGASAGMSHGTNGASTSHNSNTQNNFMGH